MKKINSILLSLAMLIALTIVGAPYSSNRVAAQSGDGEPEDLALIHQANERLAAMGLNIAVEQIEFFTIGNGRPSARIHQLPFRWVAGDPRRLANGDNITYIVDPSWGAATASGVTQADTEAAIDRAMTTWDNEKCLKKVNVVKTPYPGGDVTIFDAFFCGGGFGDPFAADIVNAGWFPAGCFGSNVLAFSVSFIFIDGSGNPTDINGDNYIDTALNEVYYNDRFGGPLRPLNPWGIDVALPGIDVETVALHENGHSLGLGHFGPPPAAVMNPVYAGIRHSPLAIDRSGMCTMWSSWPK